MTIFAHACALMYKDMEKRNCDGTGKATPGNKGGRIVIMLILAILIGSCSTKKNTPATRFYHATTARFNTLYNGQVAFLEGQEAQLKGHKDDYNRLLPMYPCMDKTSAAIGKSSYETAITKSEKAIKVHSIKKRPTSNSNKKKTAKEKEYLARKEFNPYLYHAWLTMAEAQFNKGEFIEAASTYNYILRLYSTQPEVSSVAKAMLARCYVALEWPYDAEDVLNKMKRDSISRQGGKERDNTMAAYMILTQQYNEAIPYLKSAIKNARPRQNKPRLNFLLGQLYKETGQNEMAYKAMSKVIRSNPPYETAFNARIMQTEVMPKSKFHQMISRLKRMARSDKNKDFLDKVYYAMGNIYMNSGDTLRCIYAWEKGVKEATKSGPDKAVLLLRLSQLYWNREQYIEAARTYNQCAAILNKEHEEYEEVELRNKVLTELEPHLSAVKLQDSLQALAKMPEAEYLAAIDRVIEDLKKKEKEEEKKLGKQNAAGNTAGNAGNMPGNANHNNMANRNNAAGNAGSGQNGPWYFYNPATVKRGISDFQKKWGGRANEDFWQIKDKQGLIKNDSGDEGYDYSEGEGGETDNAASDSTMADDQAQKDSLANDPHNREYYIRQIPFTEEQMEESNALLCDGLYNSGILEQEKLENFPLAERTMLRLITDFPDHGEMDNVYYHLFLLYGRIGQPERAEHYRELLIEEFPESKLAQLLGNPNYEMISRDGKHIEDSVYQAAYRAYQTEDYGEVEKNYRFSTDNFPQGQNRARMMFIRAMSQLYSGQRDTFLVTLKDVIQKFPKDEVTELANSIVKGINNGRLLMDDRYDASSIWGRRTRQDNDSTETAPELNEDRYSNFAFVIAYPTGSLDEDQLLFEMARYNFTNFMVRNFDIETTENQGISMMLVKGFLSYDEVHSYAQLLYADKHMNTLLDGLRTLLISEDNLKMIGTDFSFDDYKDFYDEKFAPLEVPEDLQIDEPTDLEIIDPDEYVPEEETEEETEEGGNADDFPYGF